MQRSFLKLFSLSFFLTFILWGPLWGKVRKTSKGNAAPSKSLSPSLPQLPVNAEPDFYLDRVQSAFNRRCIACHSCFESPCQLNLQSYEGLVRGANKDPVYRGTRISSSLPTRLGEDVPAATEVSHFVDSAQKWKESFNFFDVLGTQNSFSVMRSMIAGKIEKVAQGELQKPLHGTSENEYWQCSKDEGEFSEFQRRHPESGMPYGFYADFSSTTYLQDILQWIAMGAPAPRTDRWKEALRPSPRVIPDLSSLEEFLNKKDLRHRIVARYLYEHLFLAHIYFSKAPTEFYQLIRSRRSADTSEVASERSCQRIDPIVTRRPNDDPGTSNFEYCLRRITQAIVTKNHIPFEINSGKISRWNDLFFSSEWEISNLPPYDRETASNPFVAFKDIPAKSRYQFLLDDSQYEVATFTKGPVCNGAFAVNSIQDQFYVFFMDPNSDVYIKDSEFRKETEDLLVLPGAWGSDVPPGEVLKYLDKLRKHRNEYWDSKYEALRKTENHPKGFSLTDIWNGEGYNDNAVLTVFRHNDNAYVSRGAVGDVSKTIFLLDYTLLERLVYNLVVDFDVFGSGGHQYLTRTYMDFIRIEAEENFLTLLTPSARTVLRKYWNSSVWPTTQLILKLINDPKDKDYPTQIGYSNLISVEERPSLNSFERKLQIAKNQKVELVKQLLFNRMNNETRGPIDRINWRQEDLFQQLAKMPLSFSPQHVLLSQISSVPVSEKPFPLYFPDVAYLLVEGEQKQLQLYTVIHNKEHTNLAWVLAEDQRRLEEEDTLTITPGFRGTYPNYFFKVSESQLQNFVKEIAAIKDAKSYRALQKLYGVDSMSPDFWKIYDQWVEAMRLKYPTEAGFLDLSRYENTSGK